MGTSPLCWTAIQERNRTHDEVEVSLGFDKITMANCLAADRAVQSRPKEFLNATVKPLQKKEETIYVVPKSDAEDHVKKWFPHK